MNNLQFLEIIKKSFIKYLKTSPRSNEKLKILHGAISLDFDQTLKAMKDKNDVYTILSLGFNKGVEGKIIGRYVDKAVDITIYKNGNPITGIAVKYVMSNYMQNSNNYFENMLGETANIRCNNIPYFQIFIIPDKIPYFDKNGIITKWEQINEHNIKKYITLSEDNVDTYMHTPNKTLIYIVNISDRICSPCINKNDYKNYYCNNEFSLVLSDKRLTFSQNVIYNDYEKFVKKVVYTILGL